MILLLISCIAFEISALSVDCDELYDDETLSQTWGYVYYSCNGTVRANESSNSNATELFGMHKHGRNSTDLQRIVLTDQNLTSFPSDDFLNYFPYLRHIVLSFNSISHVTNDDLKIHKVLNVLLMDHNQISYLESNLFVGLDSLLIVNFDYNNIQHIGNDIKLPGRVHLKNNPCVDEEFEGFYDRINPLARPNFISRLQSQCAPIEPQTAVILKSVKFEEKSHSFMDRTEEKGPEPITEEPSLEMKPAKMGESMQCVLQNMMGNYTITERCRQIMMQLEERDWQPEIAWHMPEVKIDSTNSDGEIAYSVMPYSVYKQRFSNAKIND